MPSFVGASLPGVPPVHYVHDALFEDLSKQMSISASRRQSRGNSALSGNAMRVVKPSSANNSPRNNLTNQRRRTLMNDPLYIQRTQQMMEQTYLHTPGPEVYGNGGYYGPVKRTTRPISWHPSTQLPQTYQLPAASTQTPQYPFPTYCDYDFCTPPAQMPPTPAAYSAYSSPVSTFSPLTLPAYTTYELPQHQNYASPVWNVSAAPVAPSMSSTSYVQTPALVDNMVYTPAPAPQYLEPSYSPLSWTNVPSTASSHHVTTPPTPEDLPNTQLPDLLAKQDHDLAVYSPPEVHEEEEEEGDILVGLGLYDPPEKLTLLGASFESSGKGLKLEDAWEPPAPEEEEDGEEEDGEGEVESDNE